MTLQSKIENGTAVVGVIEAVGRMPGDPLALGPLRGQGGFRPGPDERPLVLGEGVDDLPHEPGRRVVGAAVALAGGRDDRGATLLSLLLDPPGEHDVSSPKTSEVLGRAYTLENES